MAAILKSEILENLHTQVTNQAYVLYEALALFTEETDREQLPKAVEQCSQYVHTINQTSKAAQLLGLQAVCAITEQNIHEIPVVDKNTRLALCQEIERWPRLVSNYLHAPTEDTYRQQLIAYLQETGWQHPPTPEQINDLSKLLIQDFTAPEQAPHSLAETAFVDLAAEEPVDPELQASATQDATEMATEETELVESTQPLADDQFTQLADDQDEQLTAEIQQENTTVNGEYNRQSQSFDTLSEEDDDLEPIENLPELAEDEAHRPYQATENQLQSDDDDVPFDHQSIQQSEENIASQQSTSQKNNQQNTTTPPASKSKSTADPMFSDDELEKMIDEETFEQMNMQETLPEDIDGLAQAAGEGIIDEENANTELNEPTEEDQLAADMLINDPTPEEIIKESSPTNANIPSPYAKIRRSKTISTLSDKIVEFSAPLTEALNQFVTEEEESEEFLQGIEAYTNIVQTLWEIAEKAGLNGLQQIYTIINENIFELSSHNQSERFSLYEQFAAWPQLILEYLQNPTQNAQPLVDHFQQPEWSVPLTENDAKSLAVQLVQEAVTSKIEEPNYSLQSTRPVQPPTDPLTDDQAEELTTPETTQTPSAEAEEQTFEPVATPEDIDHAYLDQEEEPIAPLEELEDAEWDDQQASPAFPEDDNQSIDGLDELSEETDLPELPQTNWEEDELADDQLTELNELPSQEPFEPAALTDEKQLAALDELDELEDLPQEPLQENELTEETTIQPPEELAQDSLPEDEFTNNEAFSSSELEELSQESLESLEEETLADLDDLPQEMAEDELANLEDAALEEEKTGLSSEENGLQSESDNDLETEDVAALSQPNAEEEENQEAIGFNNLDQHLTARLRLAPPEVLDEIDIEISEAIEDLTSAIHKFATAENDSPELLESVEQYTDNIQSIAEAAQKAGLTGLRKVCDFINENLFELSAHTHSIRRAAQPTVETSLPLIQNYLHMPLLGAQELVEHLSNPSWILPLEPKPAKVLLSELTLGKLDHLIIAQADTQQPVIASTPSNAADKQQDETVMDETPSELTEQEIASESALSSQADTTSDDSEQTPTVTEEQPLILASDDILEILIAQIRDTASELSSTLTTLMNAEDGSEDLLTAVDDYTEQVQAIWDAADMANLNGLQDVCTFINENVVNLGMQDPAIRQKHHSLYADWPQLILNYLQTPTASTAQDLVTHLQNTQWVDPLDEEQAQTLFDRLTQPASASEEQQEEEPAPAEQEIILADPDILGILLSQIQETEAQLNELLENLINAEDGSEDLLTTVETYTEQVQAIWDAADMASLTGLQEVCTFINDNIMGLSTQEKSARLAAKDIFVHWPQYAMTYLQTPSVGAAQLVQLMQDTRWSSPLDESQAEVLKQTLLSPPTSTPETTPVAEQEIYLAAPDTLELVRTQITDVTEGLSKALEVCVSMENDSPTLLEAVEEYSNQVQAIWDVAEMAGLVGLQEVCTFVNDNLMSFIILDKENKHARQHCFVKWPTLVLEYLNAPTTGANNLVAFLQHNDWPQPLSADRASNLQTQLTESTQSTEQIAAYEAEQQVEPEAIDEPSEPLPELDVDVSQEGEISLGNAEVLEILKSELESTKEELTEALQKFTSLDNDAPGFQESSENYSEQVQRIHAAAEMLGLEGLQTVCTFVVDNVMALSQQSLDSRKRAKAVLEKWPDLVLGYLNNPMNSVIPMLNHFRESQWPEPLPDEKAHDLLNQLTAGSTVEESEEEAAYARQKEAQPEDVSLEIPEDANAELLEAYLTETPQHASDFSQCIQNIIENPEKSEVERAKRIAHTLKGSSNITGIRGIANMGHHLEDILEYLSENQVAPPKDLTDMMVEAADCIESMVDSLTGEGEAPTNAQQILQSVLDWANRIDKGNLDAPPAPKPASTSAAQPQAADQEEDKSEKKEAAKPKKEGGQAAPEQVLRVPTRTIDELMRLVGELSISVGQIQERLKHVLNSTRTLTDQDLVIQKKTFELENLVDVKGVSGLQGRMTDMRQDEDFDPLEFEEYNELHSVAHSFIESIADSRELAMSIRNDLSELETMFIQQERLNKEFQATIMTTRMVPVSSVVSKLQRNVRQTCRMTGKKAELEVIGTDILIDSDVLDNLADPLMHVLRNSVDHGIESPEERVLMGKEETGHVWVHFYREGNNIVVRCEDNGQGLNYTNIRYTAIQRGLITENQELTEQELARLILMSGFSTKSGVTQVSGRGVGMDVVHTNIRQMKGTLDIMSETGKGTQFIIRLPMTLVTVHVLIVRIGELLYGIPSNNVEQALAHGTGDFQTVGNEKTLKIGKNIYSIRALSDLLNVTADTPGIENCENRPILLIREETGITALVVDELIDTHDLVLKTMGKYVQSVHGVSGASILGDGSLVPLLDLPELLRSPMQAAMSSYMAEQGVELQSAGTNLPYVMVVDDSLSVRKSLSIMLEDAGFETLLAKDGLDAIEILGQTRPNVMLVDMEMPRMNGLELTAHVRANQTTQNMPIFMITSRTTEKHREQAKTAGVSAYLTKPYQEEELLGMIDKALGGQYQGPMAQ